MWGQGGYELMNIGFLLCVLFSSTYFTKYFAFEDIFEYKERTYLTQNHLKNQNSSFICPNEKIHVHVCVLYSIRNRNCKRVCLRVKYRCFKRKR